MSVYALRSGYIRQTVGTFTISEDTPPIVIDLRPGVKVSGRARRGSAPFAGATVSLEPRPRDSALPDERTVTAANGTFTFEGVAPGDYTLVVASREMEAMQGGAARALPVTIPVDGVADLDVNLDGAGASLTVLLPEREARAAMIGLSQGHGAAIEQSDTYQAQLATPGTREVKFKGLSPGAYTLTVFMFDPEQPNAEAGAPHLRRDLTIASDQEQATITVPP